MRRVVLLCGPPGAGKTTWARTSGLTVYDRDDAAWQGSEATFRAAIRTLAHGDHQAVVIRAGATRAARQASARLIGATEVKVLALDAETCKVRVTTRARDHPPMRVQLIAIERWWDTFEPDAWTGSGRMVTRRTRRIRPATRLDRACRTAGQGAACAATHIDRRARRVWASMYHLKVFH